MLNGRNRMSAAFAAMTMAAASLIGIPASAQTGGGNPYECYPVNSPLDCCVYLEEWGGWYRFYVWGQERCEIYEYQVEPGGPSQEPPESPGQ